MLSPAIPWQKMTGREQLVWACSFASKAGDPVNALRFANEAVIQIRELDIDNDRYSKPEYEAARHGPGMTFVEFSAWYPVALKMAKKGVVTSNDTNESACRSAYQTYQQCVTDFY